MHTRSGMFIKNLNFLNYFILCFFDHFDVLFVNYVFNIVMHNICFLKIFYFNHKINIKKYFFNIFQVNILKKQKFSHS